GRRRSAGDPERDRAGASARTAAPGADPHGPQTPVRPEPPETRLFVGASPRGRRRDETASARRGPQAWARLDAGAGAGGEASSDGGLEPWGRAENGTQHARMDGPKTAARMAAIRRRGARDRLWRGGFRFRQR